MIALVAAVTLIPAITAGIGWVIGATRASLGTVDAEIAWAQGYAQGRADARVDQAPRSAR